MKLAGPGDGSAKVGSRQDLRLIERATSPTSERSAGQRNEHETEEHIELPVTGMSCASCARPSNTGSLHPVVVQRQCQLGTGQQPIRFRPARAAPNNWPAQQLSGITCRCAGDTFPPQQRKERRACCEIWVAVLFRRPGPFGNDARDGAERGFQLQSTAPVALYSGAPVYVSAWTPLQQQSGQHNSAGSRSATGSAFIYSAAATLGPGPLHPVYFEATATIIALILLGGCCRMRAQGRAS